MISSAKNVTARRTGLSPRKTKSCKCLYARFDVAELLKEGVDNPLLLQDSTKPLILHFLSKYPVNPATYCLKS